MFRAIRIWITNVLRINKVYMVKIDDSQQFNNVVIMYDKEEAIDLMNSINELPYFNGTKPRSRAMITAEIL